MGRAHARPALHRQEPRFDKGVDQRATLRPALDESVAVERRDDRHWLGRNRIGRDVGDETGDQGLQHLAAALGEMRHRRAGGLGHRRRHAFVVLRPQHAVAARLLRIVEAFERHLQQRQRVASFRVGDKPLG